MSFLIIGGMFLCAWATLSLIGSEFVRRQRAYHEELRRRDAPPPPPPAPAEPAIPVAPLAKSVSKLPPLTAAPAAPAKSR